MRSKVSVFNLGRWLGARLHENAVSDKDLFCGNEQMEINSFFDRASKPGGLC